MLIILALVFALTLIAVYSLSPRSDQVNTKLAPRAEAAAMEFIAYHQTAVRMARTVDGGPPDTLTSCPSVAPNATFVGSCTGRLKSHMNRLYFYGSNAKFPNVSNSWMMRSPQASNETAFKQSAPSGFDPMRVNSEKGGYITSKFLCIDQKDGTKSAFKMITHHPNSTSQLRPPRDPGFTGYAGFEGFDTQHNSHCNVPNSAHYILTYALIDSIPGYNEWNDTQRTLFFDKLQTLANVPAGRIEALPDAPDVDIDPSRVGGLFNAAGEKVQGMHQKSKIGIKLRTGGYQYLPVYLCSDVSLPSSGYGGGGAGGKSDGIVLDRDPVGTGTKKGYKYIAMIEFIEGPAPLTGLPIPNPGNWRNAGRFGPRAFIESVYSSANKCMNPG